MKNTDPSRLEMKPFLPLLALFLFAAGNTLRADEICLDTVTYSREEWTLAGMTLTLDSASMDGKPVDLGSPVRLPGLDLDEGPSLTDMRTLHAQEYFLDSAASNGKILGLILSAEDSSLNFNLTYNGLRLRNGDYIPGVSK
ncbi:MAG TPA: hypothetical protein VJ385_03915 [Fibrobacteria bacterium]|nr:hypothetical protein [Fibrobacteria bacterium]